MRCSLREENCNLSINIMILSRNSDLHVSTRPEYKDLLDGGFAQKIGVFR